jgi:predicted DNA-binding transcriptional regulator AlpA
MDNRLFFVQPDELQKLIRDAVRATVSEFRHTPPILTKKQVADYLGKSVPTIDRYMREGLPFRKVDGGYPEFYKESIDRWVRHRANQEISGKEDRAKGQELV